MAGDLVKGNLWTVGVILGGCSLLAIAKPADAASFDCAHANTPQAQLICRDPVLSSLDDQLGHVYQSKQAAMSGQGAALLRQSERSWLRFIAEVCSLSVPTYGDQRRIPKTCLETEYRDRLKQLGKVALKIGPFVFNRIDLFAAEPDPNPGTGSLVGFYVQHLAYPQIDDPRSPQADAWNRQNMKRLVEKGACDPVYGEYDTDYDIGYASRRVISVRWEESFYCHGTPHGQWFAHSENVVLQPTLRKLTANDIFGHGDSWIGPLQALFWTALQGSGWRLHGEDAEAAKGDLEKIVVQPDRWALTPQGLMVEFNSYEGGCYICTPPPVTVPWAELKPLQSPDALVP